jgi:tetratricopeptide (TPR) repeat protein
LAAGPARGGSSEVYAPAYRAPAGLISIMSNDIIERAAQAVSYHSEGKLDEAEKGYRAVLAERPDYPAVLHNLGILLAGSDRVDEAIVEFQKASAVDPDYEPAIWSGAKALQQAGRYEEAAKAYARVIVLEPEHYGAQLALGKLWLRLGKRDRAMDFFARTMDLRRGENRAGNLDPSLASTTRAKLLHDIEQFRYLATQKRDTERVDSLARAYEFAMKRIDWPSDENAVVELSPEQLTLFGESYNYPNFIADVAELPSGTINPQLAVDEISRAFEIGTPGVASFDGLLTDEALARLQRYLLCSTVWFDFSHIGGFLAAYLEDGLACPLLLQIADDVRKKFPQILGDHSLTQAWAFKGLAGDQPIDIHADDAVVSLNFWVTPDSANLTPKQGGLEIYTVPPPDDWAVTDYDQDKAAIRNFLEGQENQKITVPYGENRAVLFDSRLFHGSDAPKFAAGYENHRINITMLFGTR